MVNQLRHGNSLHLAFPQLNIEKKSKRLTETSPGIKSGLADIPLVTGRY